MATHSSTRASGLLKSRNVHTNTVRPAGFSSTLSGRTKYLEPVTNENSNNGIYISNIHKSFTDSSKLKATFEDEYGLIIKIHFPKDPSTGLCYGYASIFFEKEQSAIKAITDQSKISINGRRLKIERFVNKDERKIPERNLYIKDFRGAFVHGEDLVNLFRRIGPIVSYKLEKDKNGKLKGYGFICFENSDDAKSAIRRLHNYVLPVTRQRLHVAEYESKLDRAILHERNLNGSRTKYELGTKTAPTTKEKLKILELERRLANLELESGRPKSQDEQRPEEQKEVFDSASASSSEEYSADDESESETTTSGGAQPSSVLVPIDLDVDDQLFTNLYVKHFNGVDIKTDSDLEKVFKIFGPILSVKICGKDFGYVRFKNPLGAQRAVTCMNGAEIGNGRELVVVKAMNKTERERKLTSIDRNGFEEVYKDYWATRPSSPKNKNDPCKICGMKELDLVTLDCHHSHCKQCLTNWLTFYIQEHEVEAMHCPERNCENQFEPNLVKALVGRKIYKIYDTLLLEAYLETLNDIVYCTRCQFPVPVDLDCSKALAHCNKCDWHFIPNINNSSEWEF